jgi:pimeloyl-ACP methyl ester carboxylesterase
MAPVYQAPVTGATVTGMDEFEVTRGDVTLVGRELGDGPAVLFLHGWPDTGLMWESVATDVAAAGFRCLMPDLRGCGHSSKPEAVADYNMVELVADVVAICDQRGLDRPHVVGHDWGANLAWVFASFVPERVERLAAVSVGHPSSFCAAGLEQQMRSWYALLFSQPGIGEKFLRYNDYEMMRVWMNHPRVEDVIVELERDGQMEAHLRWYQANFRADAFFSPPPNLPHIAAPTLGVWTTGDGALGEKQMTGSAAFCDNGFTYERVEGHGHWLAYEAPSLLAQHLTNFFAP